MKKLLIRLAIGLALLVVAALIAVFLSLNSIAKKGVENVGPKLTKADVRLGSANLSPFSGQGRLTRLFVGNPEGYKTPSAIQVGDVKIGVQVSSLMSETLVIDEITLEAPEITFEGNLSGNNLSKILDNIEAATGGDKPETSPGAKSEKKFFVKEFLVKSGKINVSFNTPLGGTSGSLVLPEVHLQNVGSREKGVTAAELSKQLMKPILAAATKAVAENVSGLGKSAGEIGKGATDQLNKAAQGMKDLFKK